MAGVICFQHSSVRGAPQSYLRRRDQQHEALIRQGDNEQRTTDD